MSKIYLQEYFVTSEVDDDDSKKLHRLALRKFVDLLDRELDEHDNKVVVRLVRIKLSDSSSTKNLESWAIKAHFIYDDEGAPIG